MAFRKNKNGEPTSFILYHPVKKKNLRFSIPEEYRDMEKAKEYKHKIEIKLGIAQQRAQRRFEFLNKYKNQGELFEAFVKYRKKTRPRAYYEEGSRLKNYTFPFFIGEMNLNHPSKWYSYWNEFHDYLSSKKIRNNTKSDGLATNTKNNIVKATNAFISFVEQKEASGDPIMKIPEFKFEEKGRRGIESVYTEEDFENLVAETQFPMVFKMLYHTGMRVNEVLSLEKRDILIGKLPSVTWIFKTLQDNGIDSYGYILLKHQYDKDGAKKPLKGKKKIAPENNRIIPLTNEKFVKELFFYTKKMTERDRVFNVTYRKLYNDFLKIRDKIQLSKEKDIHSLRHTFTTRFVRWCGGDPRAVEKVLGHSKSKVTEIYNHLAEEIEANKEKGIDDPNAIKPLKIG